MSFGAEAKTVVVGIDPFGSVYGVYPAHADLRLSTSLSAFIQPIYYNPRASLFAIEYLPEGVWGYVLVVAGAVFDRGELINR